MKTGRTVSPAAFAVILLLKGYQLMISPWLGRNCRFYPTCSSYAVESLRTFGLMRGGALALLRIAKCAPWHPGGYDPVPASFPGFFGTGRRTAEPDENYSSSREGESF